MSRGTARARTDPPAAGRAGSGMAAAQHLSRLASLHWHLGPAVRQETSAAPDCCDDCAGVEPYIYAASQPHVDALGDVHCSPAAGSTGIPKITDADRAAYERDVNMATENVYDGSDLFEAGKIAVYSHLAVPMRDGAILYADLYRPAGPGRYPTLIARTPYNHEHMKVDFIRWAQEGFAFLEMYVRGRIESEGKWEPFRNDAQDGYDAIEWAAAQPWSSGKVAAQGGSYPGQNQWMTAVLKPPSLVCMKPNVAATSLYHNWCYHGGCFRLAFNYGWGVVRMPHRVMKVQSWHDGPRVGKDMDYSTILRHLPLETGDLRSSNTVVQFYRDWLAHPEYDDYWRHVSVEERFDDVEVPAHTEGGWFDIFLMGTLNGYMGTKHLGSRLTVGPWGHGASQKFGDLDFGPMAYRDRQAADAKWFRHHLCGAELGLPADKPVEIFYMGSNTWQFEKDWPIPGQVSMLWHCGINGALNSEPRAARAAAGQDSFEYDPDDPCPTLGGNNCCGAPTIAGPKDQRQIEARSDVLSYTSAPLDEALAIAGPVSMRLNVASTSNTMDWMVKLVDVYPSGEAYNIAEGILRVHQDRAPATDGTQLVDMVGTANVFLPGHSIRVDITSSNFPQFARAENAATNTVLLGVEGAPTAIVLPVVPLPSNVAD